MIIMVEETENVAAEKKADAPIAQDANADAAAAAESQKKTRRRSPKPKTVSDAVSSAIIPATGIQCR